MEVDSSDGTFFFEQQTFRRISKRYKKSPEELPSDLRFAHLNPRVAAYLASKEKEQNNFPAGFEEDSGPKTLIPEINETVAKIKQTLNATLSNDADSQRFLFEDSKAACPNVLLQLARVLYLFDGLNVRLPRSVEYQLKNSHEDLINDVIYVPREWQVAGNKEDYEKKVRERLKGENKEEGGENLPPGGRETPSGQTTPSSVRDQDEDSRSSRDSESSVSSTSVAMSGGKSSTNRGRTSKLIRDRTEVLTDIVEDDEDKSRVSSVAGLGGKADSMPKILVPKKESREKPPQNIKPKTRLEKYKTGMHLDARQSVESRTSIINARKSQFKNDDSGSIYGDLSDTKSIIGQPGYWSVISFQLSSRTCDEKGWIVHPNAKADRERETLFEWATQQLKLSIQSKKRQDLLDKEYGTDKPVVFRCYGDPKKEGGVNKGRRSAVTSALMRGETPSVPDLLTKEDDKQIFMTSVSDGSTFIFYPSGRPAIMTSAAGLGKPGYYTVAYDDTSDNRVLAVFTPSGRGCCYHDNNIVKYLAMDNGATISDIDGSVSKRWDWPANGAKLNSSLAFQLNPHITFRCVNHAQSFLHFSCQKETTKVCVGPADGATELDSKDEPGQLLSGMCFSSQSARDLARPSKTTRSQPKPKNKQYLKSKEKRASVQQAEIRKLIDNVPEPEPLQNDMEADKHLVCLQRKIKNLVEDWMDHYRLALGMAAPQLGTLRDRPRRRTRETQSAKSSPGGTRVMIESAATYMPRVNIGRRIPSAPAGRLSDKIEHPPDVWNKHEGVNVAVKFDERPEEIDERDSYAQSTQFQSSLVSGSAGSDREGVKLAQPRRKVVVTPVDPSVSRLATQCCVTLHGMMLGDSQATCHCSKHKIPSITDIEYDDFLQKHVQAKQLIIVCVVSSLFPDSSRGENMLEAIYCERNRNRTRPCLQSRSDPFRLVLYDMASAAEYTDYTQPMLLRRHNVVPNMCLMYEGGRLVFCDHIFNGYGNARKDFQKQVLLSRRAADMQNFLPKDFRFCPQSGRHGPRAAWGGEIGGAGIGRHASAGLSLESSKVKKKSSFSSLTSDDSSENSLENNFSGAVSTARYISLTFSAGQYNPTKQHMSASWTSDRHTSSSARRSLVKSAPVSRSTFKRDSANLSVKFNLPTNATSRTVPQVKVTS